MLVPILAELIAFLFLQGVVNLSTQSNALVTTLGTSPCFHLLDMITFMGPGCPMVMAPWLPMATATFTQQIQGSLTK